MDLTLTICVFLYLFVAFVIRMALAYMDGRIGDRGVIHIHAAHAAAIFWPISIFGVVHQAARTAYHIGESHREAKR